MHVELLTSEIKKKKKRKGRKYEWPYIIMLKSVYSLSTVPSVKVKACKY